MTSKYWQEYLITIPCKVTYFDEDSNTLLDTEKSFIFKVNAGSVENALQDLVYELEELVSGKFCRGCKRDSCC